MVAGKVVHLGDQLESVNTPRARAEEALKLMQHFDDFLDGETSVSPVLWKKQDYMKQLTSSRSYSS